MRNGDLGNGELPRIWWVVEGLVLLDIKPISEPRSWSASKARDFLRNSYEINTFVKKRIWDITWRKDIRCNLVTFHTNPHYVQALQDWFDEVDYPAPLYPYTQEQFMDDVVTLPSCWQVLDPNPNSSLTYGVKGTFFAPNEDFDPLYG